MSQITYLVVIFILIVLLIIASLVVKNLLSKVEKYEEDILLKDEYLKKMTDLVSSSESRLKTLDMNGAFESDDEVGYFFKSLKEMMFVLSAYSQNYNQNENNK